MTFDEWWDSLKEHRVLGGHEALRLFLDMLPFPSDTATDHWWNGEIRAKAREGWDEHGGEIQEWDFSDFYEAMRSEVIDLLVYGAALQAYDNERRTK